MRFRKGFIGSILVFFFSFCVYSESSLLGQHAAKQQLHSVSDTQDTASATTEVSDSSGSGEISATSDTSSPDDASALDDAAEMAKVQSIMRQSQQIQASKSASSTPPVETVPATVSALVPVSTATPSSESNQALQAMINRSNQVSAMNKQQTDDKIDALSQDVKSLQDQAQRLTQALSMLNQQVSALSSQGSSASDSAADKAAASEVKAAISSVNATTVPQSHSISIYLWMLVLLVVLVGFVLLLKLQSTVAKLKAGGVGSLDNDQLEEEFDFMGSDEAIPAQLDLARTYIAMNDIKQAKEVLRNVLKKGSLEQKREAQDLLDNVLSKR